MRMYTPVISSRNRVKSAQGKMGPGPSSVPEYLS